MFTSMVVGPASFAAAGAWRGFFRGGSRLFVATGNEVSGSVSILEVVF
jgi:hypothetical protein